MADWPDSPQLKRSFKLDKLSMFFRKASSFILHANATDGKYPHLCPLASSEEPSARKEAVRI